VGVQIIDVSIVSVPTQHNGRDENATIKAGDVPADWANKPAKSCPKDTDARWAKKHALARFLETKCFQGHGKSHF